MSNTIDSKAYTVDCLGPQPSLEPATFSIPPLACDSHAHVIALDPDYPMVSTRSYTAPAASIESYIGMLDAQGMDRGVLVQVSVHGTDNRLMLEALRAHPERLRGVAVVDANVSDHELQTLHDAGVRGLRLNVLFGGGIGFDAMEKLAARIAPMGWHLQFLADVARFDSDLLTRLQRLPCPGVLDHMGFASAAEGTESAGFKTLTQLVRDAGFWVKLSGANRISSQFETFDDVVPLARRLVELAPDRLVWGSDWPHVDMQQMPNTGRLRNALAQWVPDEAVRNRILVDNPARLYDFKS